MAMYLYYAFAKDGSKKRGTIDASSESAVREHLYKSGLYPVEIILVQDSISTIPWYKRIFLSSITIKEKLLFTKQLAVLLHSGVPLLKAIELLADQFEGQFKSLLIRLKDEVREGQSLANGLAKYPKVFDTIYVQLVRAGEASGKLEPILERLGDFIEKRDELRKRIKGILMQPMIQLVIIFLIAGFLTTNIVPKIIAPLRTRKKPLPQTTIIVMAISDALLNHYIIIGGIAATIIGSLWYFSRTNFGAQLIDNAKLKVPIISFFSRKGAVVQFSRTLGMLVESGVNLAEALDIVVKITNNRILAQTLQEARDNIVKQGKIAEYLKQTGLFEAIDIHLISNGEQSGQLGFMLNTIAQQNEKELSEFTDTLSAQLQPLMIVIMGAVVGFIVMAIMGPMMEMSNAL